MRGHLDVAFEEATLDLLMVVDLPLKMPHEIFLLALLQERGDIWGMGRARVSMFVLHH